MSLILEVSRDVCVCGGGHVGRIRGHLAHTLPSFKQTRAEDAAVGAICSPLLDFPLREARGVIFNIVGGLDLSLTEASSLRRRLRVSHRKKELLIGGLVVLPDIQEFKGKRFRRQKYRE